ncbi:MAG: methionine gamma-lyase family protein [Alicyclobacillus herbarius]|uniref:methionine gamma-lyase family protein n=1 Tax=Alicyclobacillus herbarius TaxID=122960 RepID=UPI0003FE772E|nr:methionine gamma-lyase family protein [Alicyclobacillus herbarius]MCL6631498.1 methionine gamma-lyase family protein [Alicyclobacillus herbarius]
MQNTGSSLLKAAWQRVQPVFTQIDAQAIENQRKVLRAFQSEQVAAHDLLGTTGYGLDDAGRDKLESVWARVFATEAALVRPQIVSGTHALRLGLFAALRPGDHLLFVTGTPYDTLESVIGLRNARGSLRDWGVECTTVPLGEDGQIDLEACQAAIRPQTKVVMFQRSRGYSDRRAFSVKEIGDAIDAIRKTARQAVMLVDNCYGEFVETLEPSEVGADLVIGSLIKNPGGGLATTGGYLVGRQDLIEAAADQLYAPGLGRESGPTHTFLRSFYQGLFLAPHVVAQALKGSVLAAAVFEAAGLKVSPRWSEPRTDLILSIRFDQPDPLLAFCRAVQASAPIDSFVRPEAAPMPGYDSPIVMAAGTFVQGGSLELSADAPLRPPYVAYMQGGLTLEHVYLALEKVLETIPVDQR